MSLAFTSWQDDRMSYTWSGSGQIGQGELGKGPHNVLISKRKLICPGQYGRAHGSSPCPRAEFSWKREQLLVKIAEKEFKRDTCESSSLVKVVDPC